MKCGKLLSYALAVAVMAGASVCEAQAQHTPHHKSHENPHAALISNQALQSFHPLFHPDPQFLVDYPRPQCIRKDWQSLNGPWDFAFDDDADVSHLAWHQGLPPGKRKARIIVPFPYQSLLSGINSTQIHKILWYERAFHLKPANVREKDILLHIGASDYETDVWINGHHAGENTGGHVPFTLDITPYLNPPGADNQVVIRVEDSQDPSQPRGKQSLDGNSSGMYYHNTSGIWQTVWLEPVPKTRITLLKMTPVIKPGASAQRLELEVHTNKPASQYRLGTILLDEQDRPVAETMAPDDGLVPRLSLEIPKARLWSPKDPYLYKLVVYLKNRNGKLLDAVGSYAGLRSIAARDGRVLLNGKPIFLKMVLDQGYWPESNLASPSGEALRQDVAAIKQFGFNGVRMHQKIEDPRWLAWCDRKGLLVYAEMPNAIKQADPDSGADWSPKAEGQLKSEFARMIERDYNHPAIITWVPMNESNGAPDLDKGNPRSIAYVESLVTLAHSLDPTRPVVDNSGREHTNMADLVTLHDYGCKTAEAFKKRYGGMNRQTGVPDAVDDKRDQDGRIERFFAKGAHYQGQPVIFSEYGGLMDARKSPVSADDPLAFYSTWRTPEELEAKFKDMTLGIAHLPIAAGLCYTQFTDVENERNGLMTYDRHAKIAPSRIARILNEIP